MSDQYRVIWWKLREHFGARWVATAGAALAVFLCALGWVEVTIRTNDGIDLEVLVQKTSATTAITVLAAGALAAAVMWRYRYQVANNIAERGVVAFIRTLQVIGVAGITLGIIVYGGRFLH